MFFIQHHARQGFVLFVLSILLWPIEILRYGEFAVLALALLGFINAAMGRELHIPIIREMADGTIRLFHLKRYFHSAKHGAIRITKPDHLTPSFNADEFKTREKELKSQEQLLEKEKHIIEMEEKKLSSLYHRVNEDERKIGKLEDEVHTLEDEVDRLRKR